MAERSLPEVFQSAADRMRSDYESSRAFTHRGEAGAVRESIAREFVAKYLPGHTHALHSAEIIASDGGVSPQCDILVLDNTAFHLLDMGDYKIVFNEYVYGMIEVKTSLNKAQLIDACDRIRAVKRLPKTAYATTSISFSRNVYGQSYNYVPTVGIIFALDSIDLDTLAVHFGEWCDDKEVSERPDSIWVLGKGFIQWINPDNGNFDPFPLPRSSIGVVDAIETGDILLPLALYLNMCFATAFMRPVNLWHYLRDTPLGTVRSRLMYIDDTSSHENPAGEGSSQAKPDA